MVSLNDLAAQATEDPNSFNWPWFVELCVCGILTVFFLFYFNRLFATLLSYGIRVYVWHHYRVWIDIQALQISLLAGRIFFKGVRYHGENETIFVHNGYITWRYWLRRAKQANLLPDSRSAFLSEKPTNKSDSGRSSDSSSTAPTEMDERLGTGRNQDNSEARVAVFITGCEWYIYNRSPLYDAIMRSEPTDSEAQGDMGASSSGVEGSNAIRSQLRSRLRRRPKSGESSSTSDPNSKENPSEKHDLSCQSSPVQFDLQPTTSEATAVDDDITAIHSFLIQALPVYVECSRVAISIGNEHTRALIVANVGKARGYIDARSTGPHDLFRQTFEFEVDHPVVQMKPNPDFAGTQLAVAEHVITELDSADRNRKRWYWNLHLERRRHQAVQAIRDLVPGMKSSTESLQHGKYRPSHRTTHRAYAETNRERGEWHGLSRYMDANDIDDHQAWAYVDYARFSTLLDCPSVHLVFYWDSPGRVKANHLPRTATENSTHDINGVTGPAYGLDLTVRGGSVNYGPWADRLRAEIQAVFFPSSYRSSHPAKPLEVGQWRQSVKMVIRVDIEDEVTLRVPLKEASKDWRWRGRVLSVRDAAAIRQQRQKRHFRLRKGPKRLAGPDIRPFGWLAISVGPDSTVRYEMDMVAGPSGYCNQLHLDLKKTRATSSVNHAELWQCHNQRLQCDLSNPLEWNGQHSWQFNIQNESMDIFLLRDHLFLLVDLIADFTAGQKSSYMTFVPFVYRIGLSFDNLRLFLNANDHNIIDNPCDLDSNTFLVLAIQKLKGDVDIPIRYFSASQSSVHFAACGDDLFLDLKTPLWNTLHSFVKDENMARLKRLELDGSYNYNAGTSPQLTDSLFMNIAVYSPLFHLQGFLIRYFTNVKENYFGENLHFRTLEEYQSRLGTDDRLCAEDQRPTMKKDNDLDVVLNIKAEGTCALMPANIYVRDESLRIDIVLVGADMRFTNYYMDLQVETSPIEVSNEVEVARHSKSDRSTSRCQLYIAAVSVYGHRLFGAPPTEPTYVCNWDFCVGRISGECSLQFVSVLSSAAQAFIFTFDDMENTLPATNATVLNDVTFLRAKVDPVRIWIVTKTAAFLVQTGSSVVSFDDWAGEHFSKKLKADIPSVTVAAIEYTESVHRADKAHRDFRTLACFQTAIKIINIDKKANFEDQRLSQQAHLKYHDLRTHRADFLVDAQLTDAPLEDIEWSREPATMPVPDLPASFSSIIDRNDMPHRAHAETTDKRNFQRHPSMPTASGRGQVESKFQSARNFVNTANRSNINNNPYETPSFTSPWIQPHFHLQQVNLDLVQMPLLGSLCEDNTSIADQSSGFEADHIEANELLAHAAICCLLPEGLRGFCSPLLFPPVVEILQSVRLEDPHSLLDYIQQNTIAELKNAMVQKEREKIDFILKIPGVAIRLTDVDQGLQPNRSRDLRADQYDLFLSQIRLVGRVAPTITRQAHSQTTANVLLVQASVQEFQVKIAEQAESRTMEVAKLSIRLRDVAFWFSLQDKIESRLQLGTISICTGGSTVDRLSMLTERCRLMVTVIMQEFDRIDTGYAVRHLIYHLSLLDTSAADPVFLIKPCYVLRSAAEHVRLADSWKVLARFRQRLLSLSPEQATDLIEHGRCLFEQRKEKAQQQILESVDRWKTWDHGEEAYRPLLSAIFGESLESSKAAAKVADVEIGLYVGQISVILDPGAQQSELLLQSGEIDIAQKPVFRRDHENQFPGTTSKSRITAQVWFASMGVDLNWNLIELARSFVKQINVSRAAEDVSRERRKSANESNTEELDLSVVVGTDVATVKLQAINLSVDMAAQNIKSSVVVQQLRTGSLLSIAVASTSAHLKLASRHDKLLTWKLSNPAVYGSYQQNSSKRKKSDSARFAGSCDRLRFIMKEDLLSTLEIIDAMIHDEFTIIQEIVNSIETRTTVVRSVPEAAAPRLEDFHIALFLHNYKLHFCLLPTLHYDIVGTVARTSVVPHKGSDFAVHIDVKKNKHILIEPNDRRNLAAGLDIPPLSGKVLIGLTDPTIKINVKTTVENITIDATAVQACIEAAYQPQNMDRIKDCKLMIGKIQRSIQQTEKTPPRPKSAVELSIPPKKAVLYSGHAVFEGLDVRCSAPAVHDQAYHSDLRFGIQETTLRFHNFRKEKIVPLSQPHFEINLRKVFAGLYRRTSSGYENFGRFNMKMKVKGTTQIGPDRDQTQDYRVKSEGLELDLYSETVSLAIDLATFLQNRIAELTTLEDRRKIRPPRRLVLANNDTEPPIALQGDVAPEDGLTSNIFDTTLGLYLNSVQVRWIVSDNFQEGHGRAPEDLVFSIKKIELNTQRESSARLTILDTQLQTVSKTQADPTARTSNSALLPEMIFNAAHFSTRKDRRFAFQAAGKALDLRLAADGILPLSTIRRSLAKAAVDLRSASTIQVTSKESTERPVTNFLGNKQLVSLLVDADFAGAVVRVTPRVEHGEDTRSSKPAVSHGPKASKAGRYAQAVQLDGAEQAVLRAPGIAIKVEYLDNYHAEPTLSTEVKVAASSNTLAPSVVPLVLEIYSSIKEIMGNDSAEDSKPDTKTGAQKYLSDATSIDADPTAILGRVRLNAGLWVQQQEFSLTCQPIARVAATARFDEIFVRINTVQDGDQERFFSIITKFNNLQASVQHVYSRESTASFEVETIIMSLMNSKHVSAKNGISAILNISPMRGSLNVKQMQDFLLFREIWYPVELRQRSKPPAPVPEPSDSQVYALQKYQELAATAALPWHAVISIHELRLEVDFGQSLGKSSFMISKLWASSKKNSDWEQNLCIGFNRIGVDSSGRMSGFIELREFSARTSIRWPTSKISDVRAPLVQASIGFGHLRLKTAFDYQPFAVADVSSFEFLMYNVRSLNAGENDRLVGILVGGKVQVFHTSAAAAQALSIVQAFERLFQEKRDAFADSLHELDRLLRRKSIFPTTLTSMESSFESTTDSDRKVNEKKRENHRLHTDVVVTLKAVDIGAFPNTFFDNQILKIEAGDVQARFAVATVGDRIRSCLGMTLGEVRVALSTVNKTNTKALGEVEIADVIERATSARGGTILKVPRLVATMQTWQEPLTYKVEYIFRSTFQGKVDVGWNYSRIRFIRSMWETHSQALAHRMGKPLPPAAVKITAEPEGSEGLEPGQEKITAVVNVPQSTKFEYVALEPPVIDTPQLRDLGEATPSLEWIGLQRDKLPNVTHSIIIVTLLEVAKEVEDAYTRILGAG